MIITYKGQKENLGSIQSLVSLLENTDEQLNWIYKGLTVELDITVDYLNKDAFVRWLDIDEGFNDKLLINSLAEFESNFKLENA